MSQLVLKHPDLKHEDLKFNTVEVHAGEPRDMYGALIPPIYQTSTFYFDSTDDAVKACDDYAESFAYSRITNSGTEDVTSDWLPRFGIAHDTFDAADLSQLEGLIKPNTKLIYVESPANPTMVLVDIAAVVEIAHKHGIKVFIDNTFATPYNTTPLDLGVDAVIHSLTKYIGGHGDLLGGAVISNDEQFLRECRLGTLMHLKLCTLAVSLGDTETLVEQAAAMTHTMIPKEIREAAGITDGMIRMSVGLEDPDDIIADLKQALGD